MNRWLLRYLVLLILFMAASTINNRPVQAAAPQVSADAYCLYDLDTGQVLRGHHIHQQRPPASTTKMMTAILTRAYCRLDDKVNISEKADRTGGTAIGVKTGQVWRVEDLLKVAMSRSANDACVALAEHIAGSEAAFGLLMTKKAMVLGAGETNFVNASGLPSSYHYSSAFDLARIGAVLKQDKYLRDLVASPRVEVAHPAYPQGLTLSNTNRLLTSYPGANGIKTGTTDAAGHCLVASAQRDGRNLVAVVLHSNDRYRDSKALLDYGYRWTTWIKIIDSRETFKYLRVKDGRKYKVAIRPAYDLKIIMDGEEYKLLEQQVIIDYYPPAPVRRGQTLGKVLVYYCGERVGIVPLVASERVGARRAASLKQMLTLDKN